MKMLKCANKHCDGVFIQKERHQKYCSSKCKDVVNLEKARKNNPRYKGDDPQSKIIILRNGLEIRNDAMGKEIAQSVYRCFG